MTAMIADSWPARTARVADSLEAKGAGHSPAAGSRVSEMELMHQRWSVGTG